MPHVTPVPGHLAPSSGHCEHCSHICKPTHRHMHIYINKRKILTYKKNLLFVLWLIFRKLLLKVLSWAYFLFISPSIPETHGYFFWWVRNTQMGNCKHGSRTAVVDDWGELWWSRESTLDVVNRLREDAAPSHRKGGRRMLAPAGGGRRWTIKK